MRSRSTHVRTKVVALLLSLIALWAFAAYVTVRDGLNLLWVSVIYTNVGQPTDVVVQALSEERRLSLILVGGGDASVKTTLMTARATTDQAVADLIELSQADSVGLAAPDALEQQIASFKDELATLERTRRSIDQRNVGLIQASSGFDAIVDSAFVVNRSLANFDDADLAKDARTLVNVVYAREILAREDAFMSGALAAGSLSGSDRAQFGQMVGTRRYLHASVQADLTADARTRLDELLAGSTYVRFTSAEDAIMTASNTSALPITAESWRAAADAILRDFREFEFTAVDEVLARAQPAAIGTIVRLALAGVLGLAAVIASIVISITTARKLVRQLERLRNAARDLASYRLPRVVERLQHGERVDIETEAPPLDFGRDEIGQVGEAFNQVQETAIRVAVEQAELRRSVRDVFLSLARRSQALLHRQLSLLDTMERRAADPEQLAELFRVDHLATRMRRNAENLIVLSGATAGRAWRKPVPMVDVLRGALAEVEDYTRVTVLPVGSASLLGRAVGDVIHLLAELIENAVSFSPPQTLVRVGGSVVGYGFAIEIEDRGLGMSAEELATANEQLRNPPEFRLTTTARLGLYVVGKLAERHGIRVRLTESPYGGTTAIVLLPGTLLAEDGAEEGSRPDPSQLDGYRPAQLAGVGRHRLQRDSGRVGAGAGRVEEAGALAIEAPARELNGTGHEVPLFQDTPEPVRPTVPAGSQAAPTALPTRPTPPANAPLEPSPASAPPTLTPAGLPWRQRLSSPGEPPPQARPATIAADTTGGGETISGPADVGAGNGHVNRDPDQTRNLMASYRSGTIRGRIEAARLTGTEPTTTEQTSETTPGPESAQAPPVTPQPFISPAPQWTESTPEMRETEEGG